MSQKNLLASIDALKQEIDNFLPFPPFVIKQLREYFRIGLTWTSNALEGNSLTESETKIVLEDGLTIGGKPLRDHLEALGHSQAYDFTLKSVDSKEINEPIILLLHRLFYAAIDLENAGVYRPCKIIVTGTDFVFPDPAHIPLLMKALVQELQSLCQKIHPIEYAALVHLKFVTIHPFIDGNGRIARLLMNLALMQHGYTISIIPPIVRQNYMASLREANKGNDQEFMHFITLMVYESHKDYLRLLKNLI